MVDVQQQSREQIKNSLIARADEFLAGYDTHETVLEEPESSFIAKQTFGDDGIATTMVKWRCDGLTLQQL